MSYNLERFEKDENSNSEKKFELIKDQSSAGKNSLSWIQKFVIYSSTPNPVDVKILDHLVQRAGLLILIKSLM